MAKNANPKTIHLKDYTPPLFWIDNVNLRFELGEAETRVVSEMDIRRNKAVEGANILELHGEDLQLGSVLLDGRALSDADFSVSEEMLWIPEVPDQFTLQIETYIKPQQNTSLEGLYQSSGNFCTQCEAEGFRKITYFLDRPDVMARFTTTVVANKQKYPVLLSNGNPVDSGDLEPGMHYVTWEDPFKKPCYLFALVAGNLQSVDDSFTTASGREVALRIFVEAHNLDKCAHAMQSLKRAMLWDEQKYGREYDLDIYMIVAVDDFNMGAMENKGLNVFNSKFVLAKQDTATDVDYVGIEGVIGHEYFHNWSGNRVTCRDWFQLTLKEGLTVFRDQQFTADMTSATVKRIDDVNVLRTRQFAEDAGPMSHPIQPNSYVEINNFYTATVYNKGAEIIRMMHTLLGEADFRQGMDLYFDRHDGEAATTEDFVQAMEDASAVDLKQFRRWYHQAGTPVLDIRGEYNAAQQSYTLHITQSYDAATHLPFHIPLAVMLIGAAGDVLADSERIIHLKEKNTTYVFENVSSAQVLPSVLRNFSAPVKLNLQLCNDELAFLMAHDNDEFNRWNSAQQLALNTMHSLMVDALAGKTLQLDTSFVAAFKRVMLNEQLDKALLARILSLPSEDYLAESMDVVDVDVIHQVREFCRVELAAQLQAQWLELYRTNLSDEFKLDADAMGQRSLKNLCLAYLLTLNSEDTRQLALQQYNNADNMTDKMAAFRALVHTECDERSRVLDDFYSQWKDDPLVIDKWFMVQATASSPNTLAHIQALQSHQAFDIRVPNRVRSLLGAFSQGNPVSFHHKSGAGYKLLADCVIQLNAINPQIAARLLLPLIQWQRYDRERQILMQQELKRIEAIDDIANDVYEIVRRGLQ
jgi:aminopeptidase N